MAIDMLIPLVRRSIAPARAALVTAEFLPKIEGKALQAAAEHMSVLSDGIFKLGDLLRGSKVSGQAKLGVEFLEWSRDLARFDGVLSATTGAHVTVPELWLLDAVDAKLSLLQRQLASAS